MRTKRTRIVIAVAAAFAGLFTTATTALAQPCSCTIVDGCKVVDYGNGNVVTICPGSGSGTFDPCPEPPPPTRPLNESLPPRDINAVAESDELGQIVTRLDPDRPSSNATIISNGDRQFPATVRISFYARTSIGDVEYCSRTELVFSSINVNSYRPFNNERLCLEQDVEFYRCDDPDQATVFVLRAGVTCVTLN